MIILDTHIWVWHIQGDPKLPTQYKERIAAVEAEGLGVSSISLWEVAKAVEHGRMQLPSSLETWLKDAISYPGVSVIELTPAIVVDSISLPDSFHKDPSDQLIVATARVLNCALVTVDSKIVKYPHVQIFT